MYKVCEIGKVEHGHKMLTQVQAILQKEPVLIKKHLKKFNDREKKIANLIKNTSFLLLKVNRKFLQLDN